MSKGVNLRRVMLYLIMVISLSAKDVLGDQFEVEGYGDLRLALPSGPPSWLDGGTGKLRFEGDTGHGLQATLDEIFAEARYQPTAELTAVSGIRYEQDQKTAFDILETYVRYRPVSTNALRWSAKIGAFFPPVSLENTAIGWTSPWTLTPSAINSWVGEDLRTIGAEGRLEWRLDHGLITFTGAVFGWNDLTGTILQRRGWAFGDRPTGLLDDQIFPNLTARLQRQQIPYRAPFIKEIDNDPGWYGAVSWKQDGLGRFSFMRYENRADPAARRVQVAWRTEFWSGGFDTNLTDDLTLLAQAMTGETEIASTPLFRSLTEFQSAYVLLGWDLGDWRIAGRVDVFATQEHHLSATPLLGERGSAETLAVNWMPRDWLRLTAEAIRVESTRPELKSAGQSPHQTDSQLQLSVRVFF